METEEVLLARAVKLHPDNDFPEIGLLDMTTSLFHNPTRKNANL